MADEHSGVVAHRVRARPSTEHQATLTSLAFDNSYKLAVTAVNDGGAARVAEFVLTTPGLTGSPRAWPQKAS
ncbi:MAG: hypothetical protein H0W90_00200 [Actinobacteria bacterium]|nr:hypothetical protein [Actinomycetota bacterium]